MTEWFNSYSRKGAGLFENKRKPKPRNTYPRYDRSAELTLLSRSDYQWGRIAFTDDEGRDYALHWIELAHGTLGDDSLDSMAFAPTAFIRQVVSHLLVDHEWRQIIARSTSLPTFRILRNVSDPGYSIVDSICQVEARQRTDALCRDYFCANSKGEYALTSLVDTYDFLCNVTGIRDTDDFDKRPSSLMYRQRDNQHGYRNPSERALRLVMTELEKEVDELKRKRQLYRQREEKQRVSLLPFSPPNVNENHVAAPAAAVPVPRNSQLAASPVASTKTDIGNHNKSSENKGAPSQTAPSQQQQQQSLEFKKLSSDEDNKDDDTNVCYEYIKGMMDLVRLHPLPNDSGSNWPITAVVPYVRIGDALEVSELTNQLLEHVRHSGNDFHLAGRHDVMDGIILIQPVGSKSIPGFEAEPAPHSHALRHSDHLPPPPTPHDSSANSHWRLLIINARIKRIDLWDPLGHTFRRDGAFVDTLRSAYPGYRMETILMQVQSGNDYHSCGPLVVWCARHYMRWAASGYPDRGSWLFATSRPTADSVSYEWSASESFSILKKHPKVSDRNRKLCQRLRRDLATFARLHGQERLLTLNKPGAVANTNGEASAASTNATAAVVVPMEDETHVTSSRREDQKRKPPEGAGAPATTIPDVATASPAATTTATRKSRIPPAPFNTDSLYNDDDEATVTPPQQAVAQPRGEGGQPRLVHHPSDHNNNKKSSRSSGAGAGQEVTIIDSRAAVERVAKLQKGVTDRQHKDADLSFFGL